MAAVVTVGAALGFECAGTAWAEGGGSIAGAPSVSFAQQEFGSLINGSNAEENCGSQYEDYTEWWSLPLTSGDRLTIDWQASPTVTMNLFPAGTNDYNYENTSTLQGGQPGGNGRAQLKLTASHTGSYPLEFTSNECTNTPGTYNFTAYVTHEMVLSAPDLPAALTGTASVGAHDPDGNPLAGGIQVSLQLSSPGVAWTTIGSGTVANGTAAIAYTIPVGFQGEKVRVRAIGTGAGFSNAASSVQSVMLEALKTRACRPPARLIRSHAHKINYFAALASTADVPCTTAQAMATYVAAHSSDTSFSWRKQKWTVAVKHPKGDRGPTAFVVATSSGTTVIDVTIAIPVS